MVQDCIEPPEFQRSAHFLLLNYVAECLVTDPEVVLNEEAQVFAWMTVQEAVRMDLTRAPKLEAPDRLEHWPLNASRSLGSIIKDAAAADRKALSKQASAPLKHLELWTSGLNQPTRVLLEECVKRGMVAG